MRMQCIVISILVAFLAIAVVVVKSTNDELCSTDKATFAVYPTKKEVTRNKVMIKHSIVLLHDMT